MQEREYVIVNGELYHYGVKGMKWGVRKDLKKYKNATYKLTANAMRRHSLNPAIRAVGNLANKKTNKWLKDQEEGSAGIREKVKISSADKRKLQKLDDLDNPENSYDKRLEAQEKWAELANDILRKNSTRLVKDLQLNDRERRIVDDIIAEEIFKVS